MDDYAHHKRDEVFCNFGEQSENFGKTYIATICERFFGVSHCMEICQSILGKNQTHFIIMTTSFTVIPI